MSEVVCVCGQRSPSTARFCASCGAPLTGAVPAPPQPAPSVDQQVLDTLRGFVAPQVADRIGTDAGRPVEERRLVTAVFADLSGFTTLAARLDPDELLAVIDPVVSGLTRIVSRYDGYVEKFAGDALLALFGAPVAHEDDAARALGVALAMQAELASLSIHPEARGLTLHVGVNSGTVVARVVGSEARMDYAVLGEAVILAQRLESLAPSGEIWVGGLTRQLVGPEFAFEDLGAQSVKGRAEPITAYRLLGRRADGGRAERGVLVGRETELIALTYALAEVRAGGARTIRIEGPAGIGKSRLLAELHEYAVADGLQVVRLFGASHAQSAYHCVVPLIRAAMRARYSEGDGETTWERVDADPVPPCAPELTAVLLGRPGAATELEPRTPDAVRRTVTAAALSWLADLAGRGPVVVLADGLQWFDAASRDVLDQVERRALPGVLVCLSGRPDDASPLPHSPRSSTLVLGAIEDASVRELLAHELGGEPDDRLLEHLLRYGRGNPLMVRELVRQLRDEGLLDVRHGHVRLVAGIDTERVPPTLEAILAARLDALSPAVLGLATTVSVIGFVAPLHLIAAVTELDPGTLDARLLTLTQSGLALLEVVTADGVATTRLRLESPVVRSLLYARLTSRRRRELHGRIAVALGVPDLPGDEAVALLAEHHFLAGDLGTALPWLRRAATGARRVAAQDTAVVALTRAIASARVVAPDQLVDLLVQLAEVRVEGGELARAAELYGEARAVGADVRAWAGGAAVLRLSGDYAGALALLDSAEGADMDGDRRLLAHERSWALSVSGDLVAAQAVSSEALEAGDPGDRVAGLLLLQLVRAETLLGHLAQAYGHADRAIANLRAVGDVVGLCTALRLLGSLQQTANDLDAAAATLTEGLGLARRAGVMEEIGGCQINLGLVHADRGDHVAAERAYAEAGVTFELAGIEAGRAMAYGNRSCELVALGAYEQARRVALEALELAERVENPLTVADIHHTLAMVAEATGDWSEAYAQARLAADGFVRAGLPRAAEPSQELAARVAPSAV